MNGRLGKEMLVVIVIGALFGGWPTAGFAEDLPSATKALPRSFQGVRLGMARAELTAQAPEAGQVSLGPEAGSDRTIVVPSKDRHLHRVEYRFHRGLLREMAIHYRRDRVPRGYEGLLERLKESYGKPVIEDVEVYDPRPEVFSVKRTVWKDRTTIAVLEESRMLREGREAHDLVVTVTDRRLQDSFEQDQERRRRQRELRIPIPLADQEIGRERTAAPRMPSPTVPAAG
jgi:hypothetical protein